MRFHIAHVVPSERLHGLHGYKEIIDSLIWGLQQLGHEVTYALNRATADSRNIVFGGQVLAPDSLSQLRPDTIIYNFEQIRNARPDEIRPEVAAYAARFEVWDYCPFNLEAWAQLELRQPVKIIPVGYAPILERIAAPAEQDIDVLIYGLPNENRLAAFDALAHAGLRCIFVSGLYGEARDGLIARAKLVLNLSLYTKARIFEVVRVSYLLANRKAVVTRLDPDTAIEPDIRTAVALSTPETFVRDLRALLDDGSGRKNLETRGYDVFRRRDIRAYLAAALG
jgi:hypothetical protein